MLPRIFYIILLILLLYYTTCLWALLYLSKKKPAVYSHTTDFPYYSFYLLRCVSDKFFILNTTSVFPPAFYIPPDSNISQQHFLYNPAIFIPMNAKSIPAPIRQPPQTNILISQYPIPATTGLDIPSLICATFFPVSTIQLAMVCIKVAIVSKNTTQSEINIFDRIIWKRVVDTEYHINRNINASYMTVFALYLPASFSICVSYLSFAYILDKCM